MKFSIRRWPGIFRVVISKRKIRLLSILCMLILISVLHLYDRNTSSDDQLLPTNEPSKSLIYECCTPLKRSLRTNIYFLKTHKTGSSTMQSVILRFAMKNSLDVMSITFDAYYQPLSDFSIDPAIKTPNNKYHVLAHHIRYDSKLKSYQYPDTPMVTLLRHPAKLFQSSYNFFRMNESTGMTFEQFLKAPVKPKEVKGFAFWFEYNGYNQMSVDLGFELITNKSTKAVDEFIRKIDDEFDFVMIAEYMDESLVLLANLMGWPLEYVVYVNLNVRPPDSNSYMMTKSDEITLMELNEIDTLLYFHFLKKFQKCMRQYGEERLKNQVDRLKIINQQFRERCIAQEVVGGLWFGHLKAIEYVPRNKSDLECLHSVQLRPPLSMVARDVQAERLNRSFWN